MAITNSQQASKRVRGLTSNTHALSSPDWNRLQNFLAIASRAWGVDMWNDL